MVFFTNPASQLDMWVRNKEMFMKVIFIASGTTLQCGTVGSWLTHSCAVLLVSNVTGRMGVLSRAYGLFKD